MKRFLALLLCFALCLSLLPAGFAADIEIVDFEDDIVPIIDDCGEEAAEPMVLPEPVPAGIQAAYDGVPEGYTAINDAIDLWMIKNDMAGKYILTNNIDLGSALAPGGDLYNANGWLAIGYNSTFSDIVPFTGVLDGNGCTIFGMSCTGPAAALFAANEGTIRNLTITGSIEANARAGAGIIMYNYGTIENCHNAVSVLLTNSSSIVAGGIVARNYNGATIRNCSNSAAITVNNTSNVRGVLAAGGIAATNLGTIDRVWNTGNISVTGSAYFISGNPDTYSCGCYTGGIVGESYPSDTDNPILTNAFNTGAIFTQNNAPEYNRRACSGGIIGYLNNKKSSQVIQFCYNTGLMTAVSSSSTGTFPGAISGMSAVGVTLNCYYLNNMDHGIGNTPSNDPTVSVSDALMKRQATFSGFDFTNTWIMGTGTYLYPVIRHIHTLWHVAAAEPSCTHTGNIEYWFCKSCGMCFSDAAGEHEISESDTVIPKSHQYEETVTAPTCMEQGYTTHTCRFCGDSYVDTYTEPLGHDWSAWSYSTEPSCLEGGEESRSCSRCGETETHPVGALGHDYSDSVIAPTCTEQGYTTHECSRCHDSYVDSYTDALGHDYQAAVTDPSCTEQGYTTHECSRCHDSYVDNYTAALGHDYQAAVTDPTCTEQGYTTHECSRCHDSYKDGYTDALGHDYHETVTDPTCTEQGCTTHTCSRCGDSYVDSYRSPLGHDYQDAVTEPTCLTGGYTTHTCSRCQDSYVDSYTAALGHDYQDTVTEPTCTARGYTTHTCSRCEDSYVDSYTDALGHDYHETVTDPTCLAGGYTTHTCSRCQDTYVDGYTNALGHDYHETVTEPTCTEKGYTTHECSRCHDSYVDSYTDPLGHEYGEPEWSWSADYSAATASFSCKRGDHSEALDAEISMTVGSSQTVVTAKVRFNDKIYLDTKTIRLHISETELSVPVFGSAVLELLFDTGVQTKAEWNSSNPAAATVDEDGVVTALKYGKTTITGTAYGISVSCEVQTLFWDVADPSQYYFKHVYWAAEKGITKGYDLEYFDPQGECTREQMMTFLWRLAGQPDPTTSSSKFSDVKKGSYYYKAVLWGVEKGITNGYTSGPYAGKFGVGLACTREQAMTFLWRMAGKPNPTTTTNKFKDVKKSDYFYKAVLWASENKIANGYSDGTYGVGLACLREHMVTFLSKYDAKFGNH